MTCREFTERLADHLDDASPNASGRAVRRHADTCRGCRAYLAQYRATVTAVGTLAEWDELESSDLLEVSRLLKAHQVRHLN